MHHHIAITILPPGLAHRAAQYPVLNVCFHEQLRAGDSDNLYGH